MSEYLSAKRDNAVRKNELLEKRGVRNTIQKNIDEYKEKIKEISDKSKMNSSSMDLLKRISSERRVNIVTSIENITNKFIQQIYGVDHKFVFAEEGAAFDKLTPLIYSPFEGEDFAASLRKGTGGGLQQVAGFGIRLAALELEDAPQPLVMDEQFSMVSSDYKIDLLNQSLVQYFRTTKRQSIFITHKADIFGKDADRIIKLDKKDGVAIAKEVTYQEIVENYTATYELSEDEDEA